MLIRKYGIILLIISMAFSHVVMASDLGQTISRQGNGKGATACIACHGVDGGGMAQAGFPQLAGLNSVYMEKQLHDFASTKRNSPVMAPIAKALSDVEIKAVATYFSKMAIPSSAGKSAGNGKLMQAGKKLAEKGNWPNDVPACFACHGAGATGIGEHFPALAGQHAMYIEQQLNAWRTGLRNNDANQLMKGVALRLSDAEIKSVSAYLASLSAGKQ